MRRSEHVNGADVTSDALSEISVFGKVIEYHLLWTGLPGNTSKFNKITPESGMDIKHAGNIENQTGKSNYLCSCQWKDIRKTSLYCNLGSIKQEMVELHIKTRPS